MFDKYEGWTCPSMFLDAKHDIWTYLGLNSVNIKYWDDPCRENEILVYMVANLINGKVEFVPWFKVWFVNLFGLVFGKMKVLKCPLSRKWDFGIYAYKFEKKEGQHFPWFKTWYVNLFGFVFVKMKVLECPLCKNEILAYMVTCLTNIKVELVPRCPVMRNMIFEPIWF